MADPHIVVVGAMGAGKTTVGRLLAARLRRRFRDNDTSLAAREQASAAKVAERAGMASLHRLEADLLLEQLATRKPAVIAAAASVVDDPRVPPALKARAIVVWLRGDPLVLASRAHGAVHRPMADDPVALRALAERRAAAFDSVADVTVDVTIERPSTIIDRIVRALDEREAGRPPTG